MQQASSRTYNTESTRFLSLKGPSGLMLVICSIMNVAVHYNLCQAYVLLPFLLLHNFQARRFSVERNSYGNVAGWLARWLSHSGKTAKPIRKLFRPPESPITLVSCDPCADTKFHGEPLQRGR